MNTHFLQEDKEHTVASESTKLTNLPAMQTFRTKEWITDHRTVKASTQNKEEKNNVTIQDHIIHTKI